MKYDFFVASTQHSARFVVDAQTRLIIIVLREDSKYFEDLPTECTELFFSTQFSISFFCLFLFSFFSFPRWVSRGLMSQLSMASNEHPLLCSLPL